MKKITQFDLSKKLKSERKRIDLIDQELLSLLNQRVRIALEIGKIKKQMGAKLYDPKREKEVLRRLRRTNKGSLRHEDLEKIFHGIMKVCRRYQKVVNSKVPF